MNTKELLVLHEEQLNREIADDKKQFIYNLDGMINTLVHTKDNLHASMEDSTTTGNLNALGILQRQGQFVESRCMEIVTKTKHLSVMRRIIANEGE